MVVRAKFVCRSKTDFGDKVTVDLHAVYGNSEENKQFWQATPSGTINLGMINREAADQFQPGQEYYIDITPAK